MEVLHDNDGASRGRSVGTLWGPQSAGRGGGLAALRLGSYAALRRATPRYAELEHDTARYLVSTQVSCAWPGQASALILDSVWRIYPDGDCPISRAVVVLGQKNVGRRTDETRETK